MAAKLKPSIKSVEGGNLLLVTVGALALLYKFMVGGSPDIPLDELLKHAKTAQDIAAAYKAAQHSFADTIAQLGVTSGVFVFLYKVYQRFVDARENLKEKELEVNSGAELEEIPIEDVIREVIAEMAEKEKRANFPPVNSAKPKDPAPYNEPVKPKPAPTTKPAPGPAAVSVAILATAFYFLFSGYAYAATAKFSWLPNKESDLAGYKIHWGHATQNYDSVYDCHLPETQDDGRVYCEVPDVPTDITYFTATAYDSEGKESDYCNEIAVNFKPDAPKEFVIEFPAGAVIRIPAGD